MIVFDNSTWGMLKAFQPESRFNDLGDWRFAEMAAGLGGNGVRVQTRRELQGALRDAVGAGGRFQLIDAIIPSGVLSSTMQRFVSGAMRLSSGKF